MQINFRYLRRLHEIPGNVLKCVDAHGSFHEVDLLYGQLEVVDA